MVSMGVEMVPAKSMENRTYQAESTNCIMRKEIEIADSVQCLVFISVEWESANDNQRMKLELSGELYAIGCTRRVFLYGTSVHSSLRACIEHASFNFSFPHHTWSVATDST
jgi:hypothetical protein